jgi:hypothetical protein
VRALIAEKRKKYDVSNDIRKLFEAELKEICHAFRSRWPSGSMSKTNAEWAASFFASFVPR